MFELTDVKYKNVLDIPALNIEKGKTTTLMGASGGGKTTLLRLLNKMISPTQGVVFFNGSDLRSIPSVMHRRQVTMLSQTPAIFEGTLRDNLRVGLVFQERALPDDRLLMKVLEQVNLDKPLDSSAQLLSGGEKQRLALGRVLLVNPEVFLLDEPSSSLDETTGDLLIQMLAKCVKDEDKTIIMATHSLKIAEKYADVIIDIDRGKGLRREWVR